jgi:tRNA (cmo5U34)-methyltransferase
MNDEKWSDEDSDAFLRFAPVFVPDRDTQLRIICAAIQSSGALDLVVDLGAGSGILSEYLLDSTSLKRVIAIDSSEQMVKAARLRLNRFGTRADVFLNDLMSYHLLLQGESPSAFVSSLAVHHLTANEKRCLFEHLHFSLRKGGVFILADMGRASEGAPRKIAAQEWNLSVEEQARLVSNGSEAIDYFRTDKWNYYEDENPDEVDKPDSLAVHLNWLEEVGFRSVDVLWARAGHFILFGQKAL